MKKLLLSLSSSLKTITVLAVLLLGVGYVYAWTGPIADAPDDNKEAPINVGATTQTKDGSLGLTGNFLVARMTSLVGNTGIGTTSAPISTLDVRSNSIWRPLTVGGSGGSDIFVAGNLNGAVTIGAHNSAATDWANLAINSGGGNVGIGTATPSAKLEVNGQVKIDGGNPGVGKVLTSDKNGLATWTATSSLGINSGSSLPNCSDGQILKRVSGVWSCATTVTCGWSSYVSDVTISKAKADGATGFCSYTSKAYTPGAVAGTLYTSTATGAESTSKLKCFPGAGILVVAGNTDTFNYYYCK